MEGREVSFENRVEEDETESGVNVEERRFKVGELVEYWEGSSLGDTEPTADTRPM